MRLGFCLPQSGSLASPEALMKVARHVEQLGYDSVWVSDRLLCPAQPRLPYPASADGRLPQSARRVFDPLISLAFVAAATERVTLGTSVLILPLYNPVLLARSLATLDVISSGRLCVGVGLGWAPEEYQAAGVPMSDRGERVAESLALIKSIWAGGTVEYKGDRYSLPASEIDLRPAQRPAPKIYMAAFAPAALARTGALADGWLPGALPIETMSAMFAQVREAARQAGRADDAVELVVRANLQVSPRPLPEQDRQCFAGSLEQIAEDVVQLRATGANEVHFDGQIGAGAAAAIDGQLELAEKLYSLVAV